MNKEITYTKYGDYFIPNLTVPKCKTIGKYGMIYKNYIKEYRPIFYRTLLMTGKLNDYPYDIDQQANELRNILLSQYKTKYNVTEKLKADNQIEWIKIMNTINHQIDEFIFVNFLLQFSSIY